MYILKNAFISISRNKGRNLLIGIVIMVIACAVTITLAIENAANSLIDSYESQYDVKTSIAVNRDLIKDEINPENEDKDQRNKNMQKIFEDANNISVEDIEKYGDSDYVLDYYYQISVGVNNSNLDVVSTNFSNDSEKGNPPEEQSGKDNFQNIANTDFTLIGYSSIDAMEEFISGQYQIVEGEVFTDTTGNDCVINSELASLNNIEIGDKITFKDPNDEDNTIALIVSGIYDENSDVDEGMGMFTSSANTIITNANIINDFTLEDEDLQKSITPTFILVSKDAADKFSEELTQKGLSEYLTLTTNSDQVDSATNTISNVKTFATTFLIITLLIGGIVLFVINMINIRERKYEIGALRTIGMKKSKLTLQFISELLIVGIVSLSLGAIIGAFSSVSVSNMLLQNEINSSQEQKQLVRENFGRNDNNEQLRKVDGIIEIQEFSSIDAAVNLKVVCQLFLIGIALILISSLSSLISIQKFSALSILKERS